MSMHLSLKHSPTISLDQALNMAGPRGVSRKVIILGPSARPQKAFGALPKPKVCVLGVQKMAAERECVREEYNNLVNGHTPV